MKSWIAALLALVVAATVGSVLAVPPVSASTAALTMSTAKVKSFDLALDYPSTWTVVAFDEKALAAQRKRLLKANPKLARVFDGEAQSALSQGYKFAAVDLDAKQSGEGASAVSIGAMSGFPTSLDALVDAIGPLYEKLGATVIGSSAVRVSGKRSYRIDIRTTLKTLTGDELTMHMGQLVVPRGAGAALVTVGTGDSPEGAALIDRILASVREL